MMVWQVGQKETAGRGREGGRADGRKGGREVERKGERRGDRRNVVCRRLFFFF